MGKKGFFILALVLILIPLINAQPPPTTQTNINSEAGLDILFPKINPLAVGKDFNFNIHVFNRSNGMRLDNSTTNCSYHLLNSSGEHILIRDPFPYDVADNHWALKVLGGNFSKAESMSYIVDCNYLNYLGGFASSDFSVTTTGTTLETSDAILYIILTFGSFLFFLLCIYIGIVLPYGNKRDGEGKIISVQKLKYFKVGILFLSYVIFVWLLNLLFALANNFNILTPYVGFFRIIFLVFNSMSYPIFVFMLILMGAMAWKDLQLKKLLSRGLS